MAKNPNGGGSISKKTETRKGKTYTYWRCRYSLPDGSRKEKRFSSQAEAQAYLTTVLADIQNGEYFEPSTLTVSAWLDTWLTEYCEDLKYQTLKSYKTSCETHIKPRLGKIKLNALSSPQIQKFVNELSRSGKRVIENIEGKKEIVQVGLTPHSVKNTFRILSKALNVAVGLNLIRVNPCTQTILPREKKPDIHPLDKTQLPAFLTAAENDDYRCLFRILPLTGLRLAEVTGLTWDCVDFEAGTLTINKQLIKMRDADGGYILDTPKNDKTRIIKPAPYVMKQLEIQKKEQIKARLAAGGMWQGWQSEEERQTALVFTTPIGNYLSPKTIRNHCKRIMAAIGVEKSSVHDLRHTYAVLSIQAGDDIKTISSNLGHATVAFTLDRYGHMTTNMMQESSRRMQLLLDSII